MENPCGVAVGGGRDASATRHASQASAIEVRLMPHSAISASTSRSRRLLRKDGESQWPRMFAGDRG
jgi:hypothetical protein